MGIKRKLQHATKIFRQSSKEGGKGAKGRSNSRKERKEAWSKREEAKGELWDIHLQGPKAGPPGHWCIQQGHEYHELLCNDIFERIAAESSRLAHYNKRSTISSR